MEEEGLRSSIMVQALPQLISFEAFLDWYPEDGKRYELHDGLVVEMPPPTGPHEDLASFLIVELTLEIRRQKLSYSVPKTCIVKPHRERSGYSPDLVILNREALTSEPLWSKASTLQKGHCIALVIEIVSTNWRDDYLLKFGEYEAMQIPEYWLIDYRALGATRYTGKPKQPTITICSLVEGEYILQPFRAGQKLESSIFPALQLTAAQVFELAQEF